MATNYKIIFACVGNSCRSQMAEGFAKKIAPENVEIVSAGTQPSSEVKPNAIAVMKEIDIDISGHNPKVLTTKMLKNATHFIGMGCEVMESCPVPLVEGELVIEDWGLEDPAGKDLDFFRKTRDMIQEKVKYLIESLE
ncbi:MAG: arsenate reductase ArsC [Candidatus Hodarchaeota archaeon]